MRTTPNRTFQIWLDALKSAALGALLTLTVGLGVTSSTADPTPDGAPVSQDIPPHLRALMQRHDCSTTGFGTDQIPASALVRTRHGELRLVSFDRGWAIYTGDKPGTLVAVCLDDLPASQGQRS